MNGGLNLPPQAAAQRQLDANLMGLRISLVKDIYMLSLAKAIEPDDEPWKERPEEFERNLADQAVRRADLLMLAMGFIHKGEPAQ